MLQPNGDHPRTSTLARRFSRARARSQWARGGGGHFTWPASLLRALAGTSII
jgi:hypothetical protein